MGVCRQENIRPVSSFLPCDCRCYLQICRGMPLFFRLCGVDGTVFSWLYLRNVYGCSLCITLYSLASTLYTLLSPFFLCTPYSPPSFLPLFLPSSLSLLLTSDLQPARQRRDDGGARFRRGVPPRDFPLPLSRYRGCISTPVAGTRQGGPDRRKQFGRARRQVLTDMTTCE